jgi:hypothetical protein
MNDDTAMCQQLADLTKRVGELEQRATVHEQRLDDAVRLREIFENAGNPYPPVPQPRRRHLKAVR